MARPTTIADAARFPAVRWSPSTVERGGGRWPVATRARLSTAIPPSLAAACGPAGSPTFGGCCRSGSGPGSSV
jgi:hypothetical protein